MPSPRRHGSRSSGLRRGKVRGLVPVRFAGGAAANQAFARVQPANHRVAGLADNVSLRGQGVPRQRLSSVALAGALAEIARLGGGKVESYPEDTTDRRVSASCLYNSHLAMVEKQGFQRVQRLGQNHWVVSKVTRQYQIRSDLPANRYASGSSLNGPPFWAEESPVAVRQSDCRCVPRATEPAHYRTRGTATCASVARLASVSHRRRQRGDVLSTLGKQATSIDSSHTRRCPARTRQAVLRYSRRRVEVLHLLSLVVIPRVSHHFFWSLKCQQR